MSRWLACAGAVLLALGQAAQAAAGPTDDPVTALARKIDQHIKAGYADKKAVPAPLAGDHEFVRRVYLDIAGRIPKVSEVRAFLADRRHNKRRLLVEKLLKGPNYVNHFSNVWRDMLLPGGNNQQAQFFGGQLANYIRPKLRENVPYDKIVREIITADLPSRGGRVYRGGNAAQAFYQVNEMKPDNLAAATSRLFLGVKIECAQCHDHPFAKWSRNQFWEYAAFFGGIKPQTMDGMRFTPASDDPTVHEIKVGDTRRVAKAKFLDGKKPKWGDGDRARDVLADWMTAKDNPYFARAYANRMWEHFFGVGLVDPVDDFRDENPASHPKLVDELAAGFVASGYDMKFLIRAITASEAYQRTATQTHKSQSDERVFARMQLKGLSPEQVFDSLATAVGYRGDSRGVNRNFGFGQLNPRSEILSRFTNPVDRKTEYQTSILQALALMNGKFVADATDLQKSETLAAVIDLPSMGTKEKLDTLFMAALGRPMRGSEAGKLVPYVNGGGPSKDKKKALADVFWALLNSSEFLFNH